MSDHLRMLIGVAVGVALGLLANALGGHAAGLRWAADHLAEPVGQIFLRLLFMLVIPLLFSAIVVGIAGLDLRGLGRVGLRTLGYAFVFSLISVLLGLVLVNVLEPGAGVSDALREQAFANAGRVQAAPALTEGGAGAFFVSLVPRNLFEAAAKGDMLGIIVFSVLFGVALSRTQAPAASRLREVIEGLYETLQTLVSFVLALAPLGVAALLFSMISRLGLDLLVQLLAYVGVVMLGLGLHLFVSYSLSVKLLGGMSPIHFFRETRLALTTAFATSSSSATLPTALRVAEENLRLPPHISRFVLTAGSAMNQHGTALFEGVSVLFLAQVFGVELSLAQQALVMAIAVMAGIGTAGIPAGSLPVIAMILGMFGIPVEGIGLILGVDRILDMGRTTLNVAGDLAAAVYVARAETPSK